MEAGSRGADVIDSVKQRRDARADLAVDGRSLTQALMPAGIQHGGPSLAIVPAAAVGAGSGLPPSSTGIYCTPGYHCGKPVWADMTGLYAGSPMIQCKVVVPTSSPSPLEEEIGDGLGGSTCKKPRTQFTPKQLIYLEDRFAHNMLPTIKDREDMARELDLTQMHIQIWFQNRRAKHRRQKRKVQAEELKRHKPAPPPFWPQHLSFNSTFTATRSNSASKSANEQTSEPSSSASVPQPASPTNEALLQGQPPHCTAQSTTPPSAGCCSKTSISETTAAVTTNVYLPVSQNGHDAVNSSPIPVTTIAIVTQSSLAPPPIMSGSQNAGKIAEVSPVSLQSATARPISNSSFTPVVPGVQLAPVGYSNSVVARTAPCTSPSPTSLHFNCSSQNAAVATPSTVSFNSTASHSLPPGHLHLPPLGYSEAVVTQPNALPVAAARQALMLETLSSTAASLMARAAALATTSCAGSSCSDPISVVSHRPTSLELISPTLSVPVANGVASSNVMHEFEGMCNGNPLISAATCRRSSSDSSLNTPEGSRSLDSLSTGSKADFLHLPHHADDLGPDFPLSGLTSPIFAEEPIALADILREEWDLFDVTPSREHCPLPTVNPVLPPQHHQVHKVVQNPLPEPSHLHHPYLYSTQQSVPVQNGYCSSAGLHHRDLVFNHSTALPPHHPTPYSMSHYHHPHLTSSRSIGSHLPHYHYRPHHFVPMSSVSIVDHHSSGVLFSSR